MESPIKTSIFDKYQLFQNPAAYFHWSIPGSNFLMNDSPIQIEGELQEITSFSKKPWKYYKANKDNLLQFMVVTVAK